MDPFLVIHALPLEPRAWFLGSAPSTFTDALARGADPPARRAAARVARRARRGAARRGGAGGDAQRRGVRADARGHGERAARAGSALFRNGAALIALRTGAPIVPLAMAGTEELYIGRRMATEVLEPTSARALLGDDLGRDAAAGGVARGARRSPGASRERFEEVLGPAVERLHPGTVDPPGHPRRLKRRLTWLFLPPRPPRPRPGGLTRRPRRPRASGDAPSRRRRRDVILPDTDARSPPPRRTLRIPRGLRHGRAQPVDPARPARVPAVQHDASSPPGSRSSSTPTTRAATTAAGPRRLRPARPGRRVRADRLGRSATGSRGSGCSPWPTPRTASLTLARRPRSSPPMRIRWSSTPRSSSAGLALTLVRPAHAAVLPTIARTPSELTAANVASGTVENIGVLVGSVAGGVLLAATGPAGVFLVAGIGLLLGFLAVVGMRPVTVAAAAAGRADARRRRRRRRGPDARRAGGGAGRGGGARRQPGRHRRDRRRAVGRAARPRRRPPRAGGRADARPVDDARRDPGRARRRARARGARCGRAGRRADLGALGAGGLLGAGIAISLVGRHRLLAPMLLAAAVVGLGIGIAAPVPVLGVVLRRVPRRRHGQERVRRRRPDDAPARGAGRDARPGVRRARGRDDGGARARDARGADPRPAARDGGCARRSRRRSCRS